MMRRIAVVIFLTCLQRQFHIARSQSATCKFSDSILSMNICYHLNLTSTTWNNAKIACSRWGGALAMVTTSVQVSSALQGASPSSLVWFGANDISVEGTWVWDHSQQLATELTTAGQWSTNEPSSTPSTNDCGALLVSTSKASAKTCMSSRPFLCMEMPLFTTTSAPTTKTTIATSTSTAASTSTSTQSSTMAPPTSTLTTTKRSTMTPTTSTSTAASTLTTSQSSTMASPTSKLSTTQPSTMALITSTTTTAQISTVAPTISASITTHISSMASATSVNTTTETSNSSTLSTTTILDLLFATASTPASVVLTSTTAGELETSTSTTSTTQTATNKNLDTADSPSTKATTVSNLVTETSDSIAITWTVTVKSSPEIITAPNTETDTVKSVTELTTSLISEQASETSNSPAQDSTLRNDQTIDSSTDLSTLDFQFETSDASKSNITLSNLLLKESLAARSEVIKMTPSYCIFVLLWFFLRV